jgi:glycosyltransferase involved in cell wall biosynthesis
MKPEISVIICAHNPRFESLEKVLAVLKSQTMPLEQWELLLIDNASDQLLSEQISLSWHPNARYIREEELGLTPARICGIKESKTEALIFVDDDNVLDLDYLEVALRIAKEFPFLGAWGGQIRPEFEALPPDWTKPYWWMLAIRKFEHNKWSNLLHCYETVPCGAGLCVRKVVANKYLDLVRNDTKRNALGRKGKQLTSSEDLDLAFTSCDLGLGTGQFTDLNLTHLIPSSRFQEQYLLGLAEAIGYSMIIMESFRGKFPSQSKLSWRSKLLNYYFLWRTPPRERRFNKAFGRGKDLAFKEIYSQILN